MYIPPQGLKKKLSELNEFKWDSWLSVSDLASALQIKPASEGATLLNKLGVAYAKSVLEHSNLGADKTQDILYHTHLNHSNRVDILTYGASDATYSSDTTITGVVRERDVTIDSAVTLTHDGQPGILICRSLTNNGTYDKTLEGGAGGAPNSGVGAGGQGGGGLIIFLNTFDNNSTIQAKGENGENGSTAAVSGSGSDGEANTNLLLVSGDSAGGGGCGWDCNDAACSGAGNFGGGGGGVGANDGGAGGARNTTSYTDASTLADHIMKYCVDWWIQNVAGKSPTSTESQPNPDGAGGGGGGETTVAADCGGGGGSAGQVIIKANDFDNTGTISADGGGGGAGGGEGDYDAGAGGGAGSIVYGLYQTLTSEGTLSASGGAGGSSPDCANGKAGTAGTAKTYNA